MVNQGEITQLLIQANKENADAYSRIYPIIFSELRHIAHRIQFEYYGIDALNVTAIVHEAYLKIINAEANWVSRAHFFAVSGRVMRQLLLNAARRKNAIKKGRESEHMCFEAWEEKITLSDEAADELLKLEDVLLELEQQEKGLVQIVECRLFANMTVEETAKVLDVDPAGIKSKWVAIKAWISSQILEKKIA